MCESIVNGVTGVSNEVEIIVTAGSGLSDEVNNKINVFNVNQELIVDLTLAEKSSYTLQVVDLVGKVITNENLTKNQKYSINLDVPAGIYVYRLVSGQNMKSGKLFIK